MIDQIKKAINSHTPRAYSQRQEAAVLLPLIKVGDEWHILYEVRSQAVSQAGDSSFPGGKIEAGETNKEAAVRETMEELNIKKENINVIGEMDFTMNKYFTIYCFVGELVDVKWDTIRPNEEVEQVYTIPLDYFLNNKPSHFKINFTPEYDKHSLKIQKNEKIKYKVNNFEDKIPFYDFNDHLLWGITANLTYRFVEIIQEHTNLTK